MDYCAQLWAPPEGPKLDKLEKIIFDFTRMIPEISHMEYEDRLSYLRIQSAQRRYERYFIIYTRKSITGIVHNIGISIRGPELFNLMPAHIRDPNILQETFKKRLDEYLALIPDRPRIGYQYKSVHSNRLDDTIRQWRWTIYATLRYRNNNSCVSGGAATSLGI